MENKLRSRWPLLFSAILTPLLVSFYFYLQSVNPLHKANFILVYGILGIVAIIFLTIYIIRKNTYRYRHGSMHSWLQAHIYIGIISLVLVVMHSGFNFTGVFSIYLLILFFLVIISGIIGFLIYNDVPRSLAKYGRDVKPDEEIVNSMENYLKEADNLVSKTSDEFKKLYQTGIRPFFRSKRTKWKYLFIEEKELINKRKDMIERYKNILSGKDIYDLNILSSILIEKEKLAFMWTKIKVLKVWLNIHMPLTFALLAMVLIHILTIFYF
jgi:cytochrome b561